jgi:hypothetical protein
LVFAENGLGASSFGAGRHFIGAKLDGAKTELVTPPAQLPPLLVLTWTIWHIEAF